VPADEAVEASPLANSHEILNIFVGDQRMIE
jgi:hypothetical protein